MHSTSPALSRREFLAATTLASAGVLTLGGRALCAQDAAATPAATSRKIKLGVVGCGDRGKWITNLFRRHGGYEIHALADYFPDRVKNAAKRFGVPETRSFSGLSAYKHLLDTKPDAIAVIAVPWFHPQMSADAIAAGIHVYQAKPVAVDVPGCLAIAATGKLATEKKLCMLVDFQTRTNEFYIESMRRLHAGAIGAPVFAEGYYHCDHPQKRNIPQTPEERLRNWMIHLSLSGDMIVEQNIHVIDVMNWALNGAAPIQAFGTCGHKVRPVGDCSDYYTLHYEYPNKTGVVFSGRQFNAHGSLPDGIVFRLFGTKGTLETKYGGNVMLRADEKDFYRGGKTTNIYEAGAVSNIATFHRSILAEDYSNLTVAPSVQSNLLCILGRIAAQTGEVVTWDKLLRNTDRLDGQLQGLKD